MNLRDISKVLLAACYRAAYLLHHKVCLRPGPRLNHAKLVVVGSFRSGGAGKTPVCMSLARELISAGRRTAVLCHQKAFDEIRMYQTQFAEEIQQGKLQILGTCNRYRTAVELDRLQQVNVILCDDGFEDTRLRPDLIVQLEWGTNPTQIKDLIPAGNARSLEKDHMGQADLTIRVNCSGDNPEIEFSLNAVINAQGIALQAGSSCTPLCGLGDPKRFLLNLEQYGLSLEESILRPDHDRHFGSVVAHALQQHPERSFVLSQKDWARLQEDAIQNSRLFVAHQSVRLSSPLLAKIRAL